MLTLKSIRIENLRSLEDTGFIELKPISILVGRNSAGKSTFARFFPLLKQSFEVKKTAPVLWSGRLVDYGSFDKAISRSRMLGDEEIRFTFRLAFRSEEGKIKNPWYWRPRVNLAGEGTLDISLALKSGENGTYPAEITLKASGRAYVICIDANNSVTSIAAPTYEWRSKSTSLSFVSGDDLFPSPSFYKKDNQELKWNQDIPLVVHLQSVIKSIVHQRTSQYTISQIANKIPIGNPSDVLARIRLIAEPTTWKLWSSSTSETDEKFLKLLDAAYVNTLPALLSEINDVLRRIFTDSSYIEPIRATAQRYYRQQELSVDEIDSKGANLAIFLEGLKSPRKENYANWIKNSLGFEFLANKTEGHLSLQIRRSDSESTNIADMGFGYSQMLPVVTQLWASMNPATSIKIGSAHKSIFVVEQPELHLHPDYQAKIADVFAASASTNAEIIGNKRQVQIIAETHSPELINRLGQLVASKRLSKDDVQIIKFEQDGHGEKTNVSIASYDCNGYLQDWPLDFLEPSNQ